ncbi:MAG: hypothetical protein F4Z75_10080 [Synechococcus sp. SB0668_bin_15]|nr:hypothetical protein [Synechococcus sp. SB0668_bin_15]MYC50369.1 hypothetical protein [Synechococcus sp. SB0662_bin_14]
MFSLGAATMMVRPTALLEDREILALLEQPSQRWAAPVAGWTVETGEDSLDYPAIWVWVLLETIQEFEQRDAIRKQVRERIAQSGERRWVYVRFLTQVGQAELAELEREEALEQSQEAPA